MLGFFAEAVSDEMTIDYDEIEDAHWFSINELKSLEHPSLVEVLIYQEWTQSHAD